MQNIKLAIIAVAGLLVASAISFGVHYLREQGRQEERMKNEQKVKEDIKGGIDGAASVRDCIATGGMWQTTTGSCIKP
jgi:hypothetical protein